jgi:hypothetical protein
MNKTFVVQERNLNDSSHSEEGFTSRDEAEEQFMGLVREYGVEPNDAMFDEDGNALFETDDGYIVELFLMAVG